jgi:death-on-curing protein
VRYLTLAEALTIAEAVTGLDPVTLSKASRLELLDSALHAPQAGFGDEDFYPDIEQKAAVLAVRIARNHPLPDGNKRLAWQSLTIFLGLNGYDLATSATMPSRSCSASLPERSTRKQPRCGSASGSSRQDDQDIHPSSMRVRKGSSAPPC